MTIKRIFFLLAFTVSVFTINAQKTQIYTHPDRDFNRGVELYNLQKYSAAQDFFRRAIKGYGDDYTINKSEAEYFNAMSAIELGNIESENLVYEFVTKNPENQHVNEAWFRLAGYFYRNKNFNKTIAYYNKVDRHFLTPEQLSEYYFNKGFSYYSRNDFENARVNFYEIKDTESKYSVPALYYYSHIAYDQENYETALGGFLRLLKDDTFSGIAPYYVAQIYYLQKKFSEVIEFAPPLMDSVNEKRAGEMAKIIGESYFYLEKYPESIPYLVRYRDDVKNNITVADKYQLAFAYYMTENYNEAIKLFESISYSGNELSQSALYHLADCYLKTGNKNKARTAFASASGMDFNPRIKEDALFNYAKVTYELSYTPFNEAIRSFNRYISLYPVSPRIDEAYNYLVMAYMNTRNYQMALESIEKIRTLNTGMERAYQRIAFFRGLELFTNLRFSDAIATLDRSLKYGKHDAAIRSRSYYWLAEAYYRLGDVSSAAEFYRMFTGEPSYTSVPEYKMLNYSLGYLSFSEKNYTEAESWFEKYVNLEKDRNSVTLADAYNRLGDSRFVAKDYNRAVEYYDRVIKSGKADVDYAIYQVAFTQGITDKPKQKIETLNKLISSYPSSAYVDDALFELGKTYAQLKSNREAIESYRRLVDSYPNSNYLSRTLIQLGLIYNSTGDKQQALTFYKRVVNDYPGTDESLNALQSIKDIYVDINKVDEYLAYVEQTGNTLSMREQDSLIYTSAENVYLSGDCNKAVISLDNYISRFTDGNFLLNAHYYRADCLLKNNDPDKAYESLMYITRQPASMFTEPALMAASRIAFGRKEYNIAAELYLRIIQTGEKKVNISEAEAGLMRCYVNLNEYDNTIRAAQQVLLQDKLQPEMVREATFNIANAYLKQNDVRAALDWYRKVAQEVNSREGAESKFHVAEILYNTGEKDAAEKEIYEFIDLNTPHVYWMGRSFLLLSDIMLDKNDKFQAVQTLQSVIDFYTVENDGIKAAAVEKKKKITDAENAVDSVKEQQPVDIRIN